MKAIPSLSQLSLKQKIGQLIFPKLKPHFISKDNPERKLIDRHLHEIECGGFIFFAGEVMEAAYIIEEANKAASTPLIFSGDYERGLATWLSGTYFPHNWAIGKIDKEEYAYEQGRITAMEAKAVGISLIYGPVVDVNTDEDNPIINIRAFGDNVDIVCRMAKANIKGIQDQGIAACSKHFPGHGHTAIDSHGDLPQIMIDQKRLHEIELPPFIASIEAGVKTIMTTHSAYPLLDSSKEPATTSKTLINDLIRKELKYDGVVITDALDMKGVIMERSDTEAAIAALNAGCDLMLLPALPFDVAEGIYRAVDQGRISESRIDEACGRILKLKQDILPTIARDKVPVTDLPNIIGIQKNLKAASNIAKEAITVSRDPKSVLPLSKSDELSLFVIDDQEKRFLLTDYEDTLVEEGFVVKESHYIDETKATMEEISKYFGSIQTKTVLVALFPKIRTRKGYVGFSVPVVELIKQLSNKIGGRQMKVLVTIFGNPYIEKRIPENISVIQAYSYMAVSQVEAARFLASPMLVTV